MADIAMNSGETAGTTSPAEIGAPAEMIPGAAGQGPTDPLRLGRTWTRGHPDVHRRFDRAVPTWTGRQLRQAIGGPKTIYLLAGHYTSFLYLPYAHWESLCFVKKKFGMN
jgi:hypothetical protein